MGPLSEEASFGVVVVELVAAQSERSNERASETDRDGVKGSQSYAIWMTLH